MHIYRITCIANGLVYIGKTEAADASSRWEKHIQQARSKRSRGDVCPKLYPAIRKYGISQFVFDVLETLNDRRDLDEREVFWIRELNSIGQGFNLTEGGTGGKPSKVALDKMRAAKLGGKLAAAHRANIGAAHKGRPKSDTERANISAARRGISLSDKHKSSISTAMSAKWKDPEYRQMMLAKRRRATPGS